MAVSRKYADLPDLDAAPEIYETPALTDDVSSIPTNTLHTESPTPSEEARHDPDAGLDRQRIDQEEARRRFEPALVGANDVNFSDQIGVDRRSYASRRRRRRRGRDYGGFEGDSSSESDGETVQERLARLRVEAEELKLELEAKDKSNDQKGGSQDDLGMGALELCRIFDDLDARARASRQNSSAEAWFAKKIAFDRGKQSLPQEPSQAQDDSQVTDTPETHSSTMSAIAACSDRLTALESTLGLTALSLDDGETYPAILPNLKTLSNQMSILTMTLTPTNTQPPVSPLPTIDTLASRVRALTADADKLATARKTAMTALTDLHEARLRYSSSHRPGSSHARHQSQNTNTKSQEVDRAHAEMFLDSQSVKIDALYQTLPTIHQLSPLLPGVLERLRSLSVIHAGAAEVKGLMDELEANLSENQKEIAEWSEGVEKCEKKIMGLTGVMEHNVQVVGDMVRDVEERVDKLRR